MEYDADTLRDMQTILSYVENLIESQFREIPEERKEKVLDIQAIHFHLDINGKTVRGGYLIDSRFESDLREIPR